MMTKSFQPILVELMWLSIGLIATILVCRSIVYRDLKEGTPDLHLHDTYVILPMVTTLVSAFLFTTFALYFIKEIRRKFSRTIPNIILLTTQDCTPSF